MHSLSQCVLARFRTVEGCLKWSRTLFARPYFAAPSIINYTNVLISRGSLTTMENYSRRFLKPHSRFLRAWKSNVPHARDDHVLASTILALLPHLCMIAVNSMRTICCIVTRGGRAVRCMGRGAAELLPPSNGHM